MGAWKAGWKTRIAAFAKKEGFPHIWGWLKANPGISLDKAAVLVRDVTRVQIVDVAIPHCVSERAMAELVRNLLARSIQEQLPNGWGTGTDLEREEATLAFELPQPYWALSEAIGEDLLKQAQPPNHWVPKSSQDSVLVEAAARALRSLPEAERKAVEAGELLARDDHSALVERAMGAIRDTVNLDGTEDEILAGFERLPPALGLVLAVRCCESEVCDGGFQQFFCKPAGVLAPQAAAGFAAIGMTGLSKTLQVAIDFFGAPYPRNRAVRQRALAATEWDPFNGLDDLFYGLVRSEEAVVALARHIAAHDQS